MGCITGEKYLIADNEGNSIDVVVHEQLQNKKKQVKEKNQVC